MALSEPFTREPETLSELKNCIIRQLETSEDVIIHLTEGDGIHELLRSIDMGIENEKVKSR